MLAAALTLSVFAASSLREAFTSLARTFQQQHAGVEVELDFAGSQELRFQIDNGAHADVFASADMRHMQGIAGAAVFARNVPVLVVPESNPAGIRGFDDLPKARRIVLGTPEVPIGAYSDRILAATPFRAEVLKHVVSRELNVRQVLAKVTLGEADAAIVYRTDAAAARGKVRVIDIPGAPQAEYPIAALTAEPLAKAFVALVLSPEGRAALQAAGFR